MEELELGGDLWLANMCHGSQQGQCVRRPGLQRPVRDGGAAAGFRGAMRQTRKIAEDHLVGAGLRLSCHFVPFLPLPKQHRLDVCGEVAHLRFVVRRVFHRRIVFEREPLQFLIGELLLGDLEQAVGFAEHTHIR